MCPPGAEWIATTLGEIIEIYDHKRIPLNSRERGNRRGKYPYYGASGIIDYIDDYIFDGSYLLVAEDGENLNSRKTPVAFFATGRFWVNNHAHIIRALPDMADDYFLMTYLANSNISGYITGAAQPKLSQANLKAIKILLPSLSIQRKIAAILSAYDDLLENNTRRIRILEEMAQMIYREWFVHFRFPGHEGVRMVETDLGLAPEGWKILPIGHAVETTGGSTPSTKVPEYWENGEITWFTPSDLTANGAMYITESKNKISDVGFRNCSTRMFPPYSVMMTSRATIGVTAINTTESCTNQGFITCIPNDRVSAYQLYFWILDNKDKIINVASGATYKEINRTEFREFPIIIMDPVINNRFLEIISPLGKQIKNFLHKNKILRQTRDLLLPKLVSGEIDVTEMDIHTG